MIKLTKYSVSLQKDFSIVLQQRVKSYFLENHIDPLANKNMRTKTILLFGGYLGIYILILSGLITSMPLLFLLWGILGLGQAFLGMSVMHDTVHKAYTKKILQNLALQIPIIAIGVEPKIWRIEHNVLHHNYTNVEGIDQDINPRIIFRFSPGQKRRWYHSFQHLYATFFYALLIIEWLTVKDFLKVIKYRKMQFFKTNTEALSVAGTILLKKLIFYLIFLYLPLQLLPYANIQVMLMFLTMLMVAGLCMTIVFQLAHVVPDCTTESHHSVLNNKNWHIHQLETTCNFAHNNKVLSYLIGGLNYQIEHHLFPQICHIHYPAISKIVKQTATEFGIPYHYKNTFSEAIAAHYSHLKQLGKT